MKLFQILVPLHDNAKRHLAEAHMQWNRFLIGHLGGFTRLPDSQGAWADDDGTIYWDTVIPYQIACTEKQAWECVYQFFVIFTDQKAVFFAEIGTARIVPMILEGDDINHVR